MTEYGPFTANQGLIMIGTRKYKTYRRNEGRDLLIFGCCLNWDGANRESGPQIKFIAKKENMIMGINQNFWKKQVLELLKRLLYSVPI